jgi:polyhydroxyalkanoate synthase
MDKYLQKIFKFWDYARQSAVDPACPRYEEPAPRDNRFKSEKWQQWPYNAVYQSFLLTQRWWQSATTDVKGVSAHHQDVVSFVRRPY